MDQDGLHRIRAEIADLIGDDKPTYVDRLARRRWSLARILHHQLAEEERLLFLSLGRDPRPRSVAVLSRRRREAEQLYNLLQTHVEAWQVDRMTEEWPSYRQLVADTFLPRLDRWIDSLVQEAGSDPNQDRLAG